MNVEYPHLPAAGEKIVYVRPVAVADLPEEVRAQAQGLDRIYAVHDADGAQLALVANRQLAFALAREHDYAAVNVH
ncbi:DUF1150 family protein [Celeribacter indicus]|uniref:DUF1150 family protein n=1 Tax=Celeribacter indicus TaxID=1208324 RepID=A0A0B5E4R1_9RHOB|nr:DUF1150 family protein [Celeribacter indicus]AJE48340.1 hypothetical protein P73_3625 [Celeribacter indicus]SDW73286.1 hypothetical protein SAMN05443573_106174 [Celeribacter indicus]